MAPNISIRPATENDIPQLVAIYKEDELAMDQESNENPLPHVYYQAFDEIVKDKNQELLVAEYNNELVGTCQLTVIPYLFRKGSKRMLVEAVFIRQQFTGKGIGHVMFKHIIEKAKEKNCSMIQLTSNKKRKGAIRFYEKLGFIATHEGFKMKL